jgi:hypothetical protein
MGRNSVLLYKKKEIMLRVAQHGVLFGKYAPMFYLYPVILELK